MCALLVILGYFVVGFILISLFTKYATDSDRTICKEEFVFGVFIWPIVTFFVFTNLIDKIWQKYVPDYLSTYLKWIQRNRK